MPTTRTSATASSPTSCAEHGISAGENRVHDCARSQGSGRLHAQEAGQGRKAGPPVHDDLLAIVDEQAGEFTAEAPNRSGSPTSPSTAPARASSTSARSRTCYSNRIVGYSIDSRMKASLAVVGAAQRDRAAHPAATIVPLRPGQPIPLQEGTCGCSKNNGLVGSMGRVGACGDNAAMESFFALLQKNVLDRQRWETREELRLAIVTWIETDLPPPAPSTRPRQAHPDRVRDCSTQPHTRPDTINPASQPNRGQSPHCGGLVVERAGVVGDDRVPRHLAAEQEFEGSRARS